MSVMSSEDAIVAVQTEWNGWRTAMVHVSDLQEIHWAQPPGAPRPLLHATVSCDRVASGEILRLCKQMPLSHRLRVCLLKCHLPTSVFERLAAQADAATRTGLAFSHVTELVRAAATSYPVATDE